MPELELPPLDDAAVTLCLARAFSGMTLVKEAQATPLRDAFTEFIGREHLEWLNELAPPAIPWPDGKKLKLLYPDEPRDDDNRANPPEAMRNCTNLPPQRASAHLRRTMPVKLWLCAPDGKRIESTFNWPAFKTNTYQKLKPALQKKFPAIVWV